MKNIKLDKKNLNYSVFVIINVVYVYVGIFYVRTNIISFANFGLSMVIPLIFNTILIIYYYLKNRNNKAFKKTDIIVLLILWYAIISTIFAYSPKLAILGHKNRYEGLIAIVYYLSLFELSTFVPKEKKKPIIYFILSFGIIQTMYAILQLKEYSFVHINYSYGKPWATGFSANPNFFAETMILCLSYSIGLFIEENKSILKKIILIELIIFFTIGLLIGNTLSCFVALIVVLIFLLVYCLKYRKKLLKFLLVICIIASLSFILASKGRTIILKDIVQTQTEITDMLNGNIKGEYGTFRIEIWRQTLKVVPDHLLHGVGIDNFIYAFNGKTLKYNNKLYDKAHNDYLQILVTQGIFSLLCYLLLYGMVIVKGAYNCFKNEKIILILPVIGYLTQIFFNISVIEVAPIFYISLGLLYNRKIIPQNNQKKVSYRNKI